MSESSSTPVAQLDRSSSRPLWEQLRADLLERIERGDFDTRFPGEMDLVRDYGVSRHTVREALRQLRASGIVEWSRGRQSKAHPETILQPLGAMYSLFRDLERQGIEQRSVLRAAGVVTDAAVAARLQLVPGAQLVLIERVRLADGEPLALDRVWIPVKYGRGLLGADLSHGALYDAWQETDGVRLTGGQEEIRACIATDQVAEALDIDSSQAVLCIERIGVRDGTRLEFRRTMVRGDRFTFLARWDTQSSYRVQITR